MKLIITLAIVFIGGGNATAQSTAKTEILNLSRQVFAWEVNNNIGSLTNLLDENLTVVNSRGEIQTKQQYVGGLTSGNIIHNSIHIEKDTASITNNTAIVVGKGIFNLTVSGNKLSRHLSYMEVFTKYNKRWKLIALYASALPE